MTPPYDYWGGGQTDTAGAITLAQCATYGNGEKPSFQTTQAATFNAGIPVHQLA